MEVNSAPSAARRRRERRLRQFMRHDRLTVAMALAEFGEDGQGQVGGERDEQRHGPADSSPMAASMVYFRMDDDGDVIAARPTLSLRSGHSRGFSGTLWSILSTSCALFKWSKLSMHLCRGEGPAGGIHAESGHSDPRARLSKSPRSSLTVFHSIFVERRPPEKAEQLVEVPTVFVLRFAPAADNGAEC